MSALSCRRCGECCRAYPCGLSWILFNADAVDDFDIPPHRCPAMEDDGVGTVSCGLVVNPLDYMNGCDGTMRLVTFLVHEHLAIDEGCGAQSPSGGRLIAGLSRRARAEEGSEG